MLTRLLLQLLLVAVVWRSCRSWSNQPLHRQASRVIVSMSSMGNNNPLSRENEIKRKLIQLKKAGKIKGSSPSVNSDYEDRIAQKLGKKKSRMLGFSGDDDEEEMDEDLSLIADELDDDENEEEDQARSPASRARLGAIPELQQQKEELAEQARQFADSLASPTASTPSSSKKVPIIDPSLFSETESDEPELSEEELLEIVAEKLSKQSKEETRAQEERLASAAKKAREQRAKEVEQERQTKLTSGVGGKWLQNDTNQTKAELYQPKSGSWGAFPRPKDISKAYGGGRRVGPGYSNEDDGTADMKTKQLLQEYRQKVGIDVPSEKKHAEEIEEALQIAQRAMQRGIYATAVSALEKVTKWCSTNSKVGSKVFLELAMAYEAVGRTQEAYKVYQTLTKCRMEDVKYNAKRLLYGLEAMEFMKGVSKDFTRTKVKNTFVDATGLRDIAKNFDDVYQTAYIDLDAGYYKRLTESVVRSNREARQILLQATGKGEVGRLKVVQALRSIARHFDDALEAEIASNRKVEPTAYIDGKSLVVAPEITKVALSLDEFVLASAEQMLENLDGSWQLQLLADKQGDGVSFYNTTTAVQEFSTADMTFSAAGPSGLSTIDSAGELEMDENKRILTRFNVQTSVGGGFLSIFSGGKDTGFAAAVAREQQIVSVDSVLLITKSPPGSRKGKDADKEHFGVWRRVRKETPEPQLS